MKPASIAKRDGRIDPFDPVRIAAAISKALAAVGELDGDLARELAQVVVEHLERTCDRPVVELEDVQDAVIHVLQESGQYQAAISYARYRDERERQRRTQRALGDERLAPNLVVIEDDGRHHRWTSDWLRQVLAEDYRLDASASAKVAGEVEGLLSGTASEEITADVARSLVEVALVRLGMHTVANQRSALRTDRTRLERIVSGSGDGRRCLLDAGRLLLRRWAAQGRYPVQVARHVSSGRLWVDGMDDPRRGSQLTVVTPAPNNPWQILAQALVLAQEAVRSWRRVRLVLPASMLGHLERGANQFIAPINALAGLAHVYLACDGRTPLLDAWPFAGHRHEAQPTKPVSVVVAQDDFLLFRQLQELGLPQLAGPHLFEPGWTGRVAVELAVNAQGLDQDFSFMDGLAMALVAAARVRVQQVGGLADHAEVRFAIFGLPHHSPSREYLERQVVQEGLRSGITLTRSGSLSEEACAHLGRVLGSTAPNDDR